MIKRILKFVGYSKILSHEEKAMYQLIALNILGASFYLIFYFYYVRFLPAIIIQIAFILTNIVNFQVIKKGRFKTARAIIVNFFIIQLTLSVFLWFPVDTGFNFYYLLVPVATFLIYDFDIITERIYTIAYSTLAALLYIISIETRLFPILFPLSGSIMGKLHFTTVLTTFFPILLVFTLNAREQSILQHEMNQLANTDSLTRITNRRVMFEQIEEEFYLATKYHREFSFVLIDIDNFKQVNDVYGHFVGDKILIQICDLISENIRKEDLFSRYGGEEFALIFRRTPIEEAAKICNDLLQLVGQHAFIISKEVTKSITISMGLSSFDSNWKSSEQLIMAADLALYRSKNDGRNRVTSFDPFIDKVEN